MTIEETSSDLAKFHEALGIMANESQVLILIDTNQIRDEVLHFMSLLAEKLPEGSYVEHHRFKQDNQGASDWVKMLHYMQSDEMRKMIKKKYLISDWLSAAGCEVPSVIFVTRDLDKPWNATHCQRAKAKLVIYRMPDAPEASNYPTKSTELQLLNLKRQPEEMFEILCKLGEGNYGSVFQAKHKESQQILAIKQVPVDTDLQEIIKDISIMQECDSPYVVKFYGSYFKFSNLWVTNLHYFLVHVLVHT